MPTTVIVGAQWGDEGKGKVVDLYAEYADLVVRFGGGANAGHTLVVDGKKMVTHVVPSGILRKAKCLLGPGVAVGSESMIDELDQLVAMGVDVSPGRLFISPAAHSIITTHRMIDKAREERKGVGKIGTTGHGIGPGYEDKMGRRGIRFEEMLNPARYAEQVRQLASEHEKLLRLIQDDQSFHYLDLDKIQAEAMQHATRLRPYVREIRPIIQEYERDDREILVEGAQGALLDIDHGTYPHVTSSSTTVGGAITSLGIDYHKIQRVIGVTKAYTTRVGSGPFPTEMDEEMAKRLRVAGSEFGSTTGRPRRCGWLDLPALQYAVELGITELAVTKLDVLSGWDPVKVCVAYELDGTRIDRYPGERGSDLIARCKPIYQEVPGWQMHRGEWPLPMNANDIVNLISDFTGIPVRLIGTGSDRDHVIRC